MKRFLRSKQTKSPANGDNRNSLRGPRGISSVTSQVRRAFSGIVDKDKVKKFFDNKKGLNFVSSHSRTGLPITYLKDDSWEPDTTNAFEAAIIIGDTKGGVAGPEAQTWAAESAHTFTRDGASSIYSTDSLEYGYPKRDCIRVDSGICLINDDNFSHFTEDEALNAVLTEAGEAASKSKKDVATSVLFQRTLDPNQDESGLCLSDDEFFGFVDYEAIEPIIEKRKNSPHPRSLSDSEAQNDGSDSDSFYSDESTSTYPSNSVGPGNCEDGTSEHATASTAAATTAEDDYDSVSNYDDPADTGRVRGHTQLSLLDSSRVHGTAKAKFASTYAWIAGSNPYDDPVLGCDMPDEYLQRKNWEGSARAEDFFRRAGHSKTTSGH